MALRWWNLGGESLWFDEAYTAWAAGLSVGDLIEVVRVDNSPPLYYLLMHAWVRVFGDGELALRAPSALASSIALLLTPVIARRLWNDRGATCIATLLAAASFLLVRYSHEARCYELMGLMALLALAAMPGWVQTRRPGFGVALVMCLSAMTWMHNMAWLYVAGFTAAMAAWPSEQRWGSRVVSVAVPGALVALIYLPWVAALTQQVRKMGGGFWIATPDLPALYHTVVLTAGVKLLPIGYLMKDWFGKVQPAVYGVMAVIAVAFIVIVTGLVWGGFWRKRRRVLAVSCAALLPVVAAFVVSLIFTSVFTPKAFVPTAMTMPLLIAGVVANCGQRLRVATIVAAGSISVISLASVIGHIRFERKEDWIAAHRYLSETATPQTLLVLVGNDGELPLMYYEKRLGAITGERVGLPGNFFESQPPRAMQRITTEHDLAHLGETIATTTPDQIIFIGCHHAWADPGGLTIRYLDAVGCAERVSAQNFSGISVMAYLVER